MRCTGQEERHVESHGGGKVLGAFGEGVEWEGGCLEFVVKGYSYAKCLRGG